MSQAIEEICAMCKHFKMKEYPEHARVGLGRCMGYDGTMAPLINPFVNWGTKACKNYVRPANRAERVDWVEKRMQKEQSKATSTAVPTREKK
jgi:hypothetical protein